MISKTCQACGGQAQHILPDYMFRYGNRVEGMAGENRILGSNGKPLLDFSDGPSICVKKNAKDIGTEHNIAHECDAQIKRELDASPVKGAITAKQGITLAATAAKDARPGCESEIDAAMKKLSDKLGEDTLLRGTQPPAKPGTPAGDLFNAPKTKF